MGLRGWLDDLAGRIRLSGVNAQTDTLKWGLHAYEVRPYFVRPRAGNVSVRDDMPDRADRVYPLIELIRPNRSSCIRYKNKVRAYI